MFKVDEKNNISMYEGDFGEILPITIVSGNVLDGDIIKFIIENMSQKKLINKTLEIKDSKFEFQLTKEETEKLVKGDYYWGLKQFRGDTLIDTLEANKTFKVLRGQ